MHYTKSDLIVKNHQVLTSLSEGWIAGLQMAALSMRGRDDSQKRDFITAFAGSHRYIVDYLSEEVLQQQTEPVQQFLLQTSVLSRMTGSLCDTVIASDSAGGSGPISNNQFAQQTLEYLDQTNLFIVPLDEQRHWYRYHHLFGELLRDRLQQEQPDVIPDLHRRAAGWYEQNGFIAEAIPHALAGEDFEQAANLIERVAGTSLGSGESATLLKWLQALPDDLIRSRSGLGLFQAWALLFNGQLDAVEAHLDTIENDQSNHRTPEISGSVTAIRAIMACYRGAPSVAIQLSRQALETVSEDNLFLRSIMAINIALNVADAYGSPTDVTDIHRLLSEAAAISQAAGDTHLTLTSLGMVGHIEMAQGKLHQAAETFRRGLKLAQQSQRPLPISGVIYAGLGEVLREWNDLDAALRHVTQAIQLAEPGGDLRAMTGGYFTLARVYQAQGDMDNALSAIEQATQLAERSNITWLISQAAAYRARLWLAQGNLAAAVRWAENSGLSPGDEIGYQREAEYTILARVIIAQNKPDEALTLLDWLRDVTEANSLMGTVIESLVLQALALELKGDTGEATAKVEQALSLGEPEGYIRLFVDEGQPLAALLARVKLRKADSRVNTYFSRVLNAFEASEVNRGSTETFIIQPLVDPLSDRELEVLQLIADGLMNREIAQELIISPGTVKVHVKNIYSKLDVHSRTQAAARARELKLLP